MTGESPQYRRCEAFVEQFHSYISEKFLSYEVREFSGPTIDWIKYEFPDVSKKVYLELILPEAVAIAKRTGVTLRYTTMPVMRHGKPSKAHGEMEITVPTDFYLSAFCSSTVQDSEDVVDAFGHPIRPKNGEGYTSVDFE